MHYTREIASHLSFLPSLASGAWKASFVAPLAWKAYFTVSSAWKALFSAVKHPFLLPLAWKASFTVPSAWKVLFSANRSCQLVPSSNVSIVAVRPSGRPWSGVNPKELHDGGRRNLEVLIIIANRGELENRGEQRSEFRIFKSRYYLSFTRSMGCHVERKDLFLPSGWSCFYCQNLGQP